MNEIENISLDELEYYHALQPIIDIKENQILGYEMLLRSKTIPNPEVLFSSARKQNQSYELDMRSIELALQTIKHSPKPFQGKHAFINILPSTLGNPEAVEQIQSLKSNLKLAENPVVLEITEDKKEEELVMCKRMVRDVRNAGFLIAVDDLGKGDSTLAYAIELQPNIVKLDKKFARDLANSELQQKEIASLVQFFGKETMLILEGIETKIDYEIARNLGVRYMQGFYFGKPEPLHTYIEEKSGEMYG